jgi:hypothetical protein
VLQALHEQQQQQQRGGSSRGAPPSPSGGLLRGGGAPVLFPYGGRWYLLAARDAGRDPSPLLLWVSSGPTPCHGPWVPLPSPTLGTPHSGSQGQQHHSHQQPGQKEQQEQEEQVVAADMMGGSGSSGGGGFPPELLSLPAFVHVHSFDDGTQLLVLYGDRWVAAPPPAGTSSSSSRGAVTAAAVGGTPGVEPLPSAATGVEGEQLQQAGGQGRQALDKGDPPGTVGKYVWLPLLQGNGSDPGLQLQPLSMWRLGDYRTPPGAAQHPGHALAQQ